MPRKLIYPCRCSIYLDIQAHARLRRIAKDQGKYMGEIVRDAVMAYLRDKKAESCEQVYKIIRDR